MKDMNTTNENPDLLHALRASCGNLPICLDEEDETETQLNPVIAGVDFSSSLNLLACL
jgi:hypothetical protein